MPNFPEEIIVEVLLRLPVKSLCQFRCVSKRWLSLISDHHFIKTHLNRSTNEPEQLILISNFSDFYSVDLKSFQFRDDFVAVHLKFPPEQNPNRGVDIWGSCDGLLLMLDICFSCILVNPSTRESRKLPKSSFSESKFHLNSYGLGHDSSNDDYKVVRISNHDQDANCADNMVSVYTLRTNLWRRIEGSPYDHTVHGPSRGILVRGALHWLARKGVGSNKSTIIVSFDLADENFRDMPSPDSVDNFILVEELGVLGGCLCVLVPGYGVCDYVWVMKEYGMRDSWIKFTINCNNFCKPLCLSTTGEVLLEVSQRKLVLFNPQERKSKELVVRGTSITNTYICNFT
ncbi:hypothetical protein CsSME_00045082 [Camellia sinensis var. sinensis]